MPRRIPALLPPAVLALCLAAAAAPAAACRLALALAFDVSRSVDHRDYDIQKAGFLAALANPAIRAAFLRGEPVAVAVYEWSGARYQEVVADWRLVLSEADIDAVAELVRAHERSPRSLPTALGQALLFGRDLMGRAPPCLTRVIDVAGDGQSNDGPEPARVYREGGWDGITVNALAIGEHEMGLLDYLTREVIRGPGAFVEHAARHTDFPAAIRRKLYRELTEAVFGGLGPKGLSRGAAAPG